MPALPNDGLVTALYVRSLPFGGAHSLKTDAHSGFHMDVLQPLYVRGSVGRTFSQFGVAGESACLSA